MRSASRCATMRVAVSTPPPGATLTMIRTGRLGWSDAPGAAATVTAASRRLPATGHARQPRVSRAVARAKVSLDSCNLGIADDLGPLVHFGPDQGGELLGRVRLELVARCRQALLHV